MDELFGVPLTSITMGLIVVFATLMIFVAYIFVRHKILVKMAARNVVRRPTRTGLIIFGLMLATAIIASAFTTGDSLTFSIKKGATDSLRSLDEYIRVDAESEIWEDSVVPEEFPQAIFDDIAPILDADPDIDAAVPVLIEQVAVINLSSNLFEVNSLLNGVDPNRAQQLEALRDSTGTLIDIGSLESNEVYLNQEGAEAIGASPGDVIQAALGPGRLTTLQVKEVVDGWYFKSASTKLVIIMPLARVQELVGKKELLSAVLLSNRGGPVDGVELTDDILNRYKDLPAIKEAGLEVFGLKQSIVEIANQAGSLFVSFFTTFGLFSIGVGLLLIFLIFSMLAAERKGEMGMSRAVGMQRRHLVQMFMAEGAIYGLGSAVVGAVIGMGLGFVIVKVAANIFSDLPDSEGFIMVTHVEPMSILTAFLAGSIITLITVGVSSWGVSKLNIVRAIRDLPEVQPTRAGGLALIFGITFTLIGLLLLIWGYRSAHLTTFGLGVSLTALGVGILLRRFGVEQRWALTLVGALLLTYWLLPPSFFDWIRDDWNEDFSIFFISSFLIVIGAVLVIVNNSRIVAGVIVGTVGRLRHWTPIVRSAVVYPLRFGFRTGLSMVMFSVVVLSVTVMAVLIEGFNQLFDDQARLGGGYQVVGFVNSDLNPINNLRDSVEADPELDFVTRMDGRPSVGTLRSIPQSQGRLVGSLDDSKGVTITGIDGDFVESNDFRIALATEEYTVDGEVDAKRLWQDLENKPGLAIANSRMIPTRNDFAFEPSSDRLELNVSGLFQENETMEPVEVEIKDLKSRESYTITVVGMLDEFASTGFLPNGLYVTSNLLTSNLDREVHPSILFFNVDEQMAISDSAPPATSIKAAFFKHNVDTIDVADTVEAITSTQRGFFDLLIAFMLLGLVVGIVALGVISARAVVERRQQIGVVRAIGFSRGMVRATFLLESSFIGIMGIGLGLGLGLLVSMNVITDIRSGEPEIKLIIPWLKLGLIGLGAYLFSLITTVLPAQQASSIAPATALRYE